MRYLNALKNQWIYARAWMFSTIVFAVFCMYLLIVVANLANNTQVRLVPYDFSANNGTVKVDASGMGDKIEYMTSIATSDLQNFASWTNRTIERQHGRFVNRMAPQLYSKAGGTILANAKAKTKTEHSQALFIENIAISNNVIRISGTLAMYVASQHTKNVKMVYEITYKSNNGLPQIIDFKAQESQPSGKSEHEI